MNSINMLGRMLFICCFVLTLTTHTPYTAATHSLAVIIEAGSPESVDSCLKNTRCPGVDQTPALHFTVSRDQPNITCRRYCNFAEGCASFALNLTTLKCSLFTDSFAYSKMRRGRFTDCASGQISCWRFLEPCLDSLKNITGQHVIVRLPNDKCLKQTDKELEIPALGTARLITWRRCTGENLWRVTELDNGNVQIALSGGNDQCLTLLNTQGNQTLVTSRCVPGMPTQIFHLLLEYQCFFNLYKGAQGSVVQPIFSRHIQFQDLGPTLLHQPVRFDLDWQSPCRAKQLRLGNGFVKNLGDRPFILPGGIISVQCKEGFGKHGQSSYNTTCSPDLKLARCSPLVEGCDYCHVYSPLLVCVCVFMILFVMYMLTRAIKHRNKKQQGVQDNTT